MLNAARSCIAEYWKQSPLSPLSRWFVKISNEIKRMEELVATDQGTGNNITSITKTAEEHLWFAGQKLGQNLW